MSDKPQATSATHPPTVDNPARTPETHIGDSTNGGNASGVDAPRPVPVEPGTPGVPSEPVAPAKAPAPPVPPAQR